jgi:hypothetical protein
MRQPLNINTLIQVFADVLNVKIASVNSNDLGARVSRRLAKQFYELHISGGDLSTFAIVIDQARDELK